ncbi:hypothetical protein [Nocardia tenerifensis]|uniref:hypothetical protein n=1 Tax=Nocardia tenerifensis TaxID=228006 RepID=UPI0011B5ECBE|nr:hypothetical protein [Nocardia tenerifensis]
MAVTDDGARLAEAAERTFAQRLTVLFGGYLPDSSLSAVAQAFSRRREALEQERVGLPAG